MILPLLNLRTRVLLLETKILTPVWRECLHLQTQHSIQGNSCATSTTFSPIEESVPMKILKPTHSGTFTFGHMLSLSVLPGAASKFQTCCMGSLENSHCPRCPPCRDLKCSLPSNIFMDSFKFFLISFSFLSQIEPTWHSNVPHLVPTINFCAQMYALYVSH